MPERPLDPAPRAGVFVALVGASGAGKDTLLNGARHALEPDDRFVFARRTITRTGRDRDEDHASLTPRGFDRAEAAGGFALSWRAHGLAYGIDVALAEDLKAGRIVMANLSRRSLEDAVRVFARVGVVEVVAERSIRAQRIASRGREGAEAVEARLDREAPTRSPAAAIFHRTIANEGAPAEGIRELVALLSECARSAAAP